MLTWRAWAPGKYRWHWLSRKGRIADDSRRISSCEHGTCCKLVKLWDEVFEYWSRSHRRTPWVPNLIEYNYTICTHFDHSLQCRAAIVQPMPPIFHSSNQKIFLSQGDVMPKWAAFCSPNCDSYALTTTDTLTLSIEALRTQINGRWQNEVGKGERGNRVSRGRRAIRVRVLLSFQNTPFENANLATREHTSPLAQSGESYFFCSCLLATEKRIYEKTPAYSSSLFPSWLQTLPNLLWVR